MDLSSLSGGMAAAGMQPQIVAGMLGKDALGVATSGIGAAANLFNNIRPGMATGATFGSLASGLSGLATSMSQQFPALGRSLSVPGAGAAGNATTAPAMSASTPAGAASSNDLAGVLKSAAPATGGATLASDKISSLPLFGGKLSTDSMASAASSAGGGAAVAGALGSLGPTTSFTAGRGVAKGSFGGLGWMSTKPGLEGLTTSGQTAAGFVAAVRGMTATGLAKAGADGAGFAKVGAENTASSAPLAGGMEWMPPGLPKGPSYSKAGGAGGLSTREDAQVPSPKMPQQAMYPQILGHEGTTSAGKHAPPVPKWAGADIKDGEQWKTATAPGKGAGALMGIRPPPVQATALDAEPEAIRGKGLTVAPPRFTPKDLFQPLPATKSASEGRPKPKLPMPPAKAMRATEAGSEAGTGTDSRTAMTTTQKKVRLLDVIDAS